ESISITAQASGGLSQDYQYQWLWQGESLGTTETINFSEAENGTLQLILSDLCSAPNDTFVKEIFFRPGLELAISANDSCADPDVLLSAHVEGGHAPQHRIRWYDQTNNLLGEGFSMNVSPQGVESYTAILDDACSDKPDTANINIGAVPDILLSVNPDEGCEPLPVTFELQTNY